MGKQPKTSGRPKNKAEKSKQSVERPKQVSIFISYASEDKELAATFEAELLQLFFSAASMSSVKVFRDVGISKGADYRKVIHSELDSADILLVLLTDRMKPSYAYPGFEVGYFVRSLTERPEIAPNIPRVLIPICIGATNPVTMNYIQAISVSKDQLFEIADTAASASSAALPPDDQNPIYSLLTSLTQIVDRVLGPGVSATTSGLSKTDAVLRQKLSTSAGKLYASVRAYLEGRISSEKYPERKIVIRTDQPPVLGVAGLDLSLATVELVGDSFQIFGFPDEKNREYTWKDFETKMPDGMGGTWSEGIKSLVVDAVNRGGENYHVVATAKGDKAFRLFVSRIVTYVSRRTEIHIYIVEMIVRHYGDPLTSRLLSAISIGLQFRFLFLENNSKFKPDNFDFPKATDETKEIDYWKAEVTELLSQMDLILRDAQEAHLMDADLLKTIWGAGSGPRLQGIMAKWVVAKNNLYNAALQILSSTSADFPSKQDPFRTALRDLCGGVADLNREYTLRALQAIGKELNGSVTPASAVVPGSSAASVTLTAESSAHTA